MPIEVPILENIYRLKAKSKDVIRASYHKWVDPKKHFRLNESKVFCMAPWSTTYVTAEGHVKPCCMGHFDPKTNNLDNENLLGNWNSKAYRDLRKNILNDIPSEACRHCYQQDDAGYENSLRKNFNFQMKEHYSRVDDTDPSGCLEQLEISYLDMRFSNVCNFQCRSCSPELSSTHGGGKVLRVKGLVGQLKPHLETLTMINFAGGEPLLMPEYYEVMQWLMDVGRTDVKIQITTNFSVRKYGQWRPFEMWRHFDDICVLASLDGYGPRGEYIRAGMKWEQVQENRKIMKDSCDIGNFFVNCTLSGMNAHHAPDLHRELVEGGFIDKKNHFFLNPYGPDWMRPDILPQWEKDKIRDKYHKHIQGFCGDWEESSDFKRNDFVPALEFILGKDNPAHLKDLKRRILSEYDLTGHGQFSEIFNEYDFSRW